MGDCRWIAARRKHFELARGTVALILVLMVMATPRWQPIAFRGISRIAAGAAALNLHAVLVASRRCVESSLRPSLLILPPARL